MVAERPGRLAGACVAAAVCAAAAGPVSAAGGEPAPATPPHVVLISFDTLRPDHLSLYGYSRQTDAPLAEILGGGVVFESAVSTSSWTVPAFASLFTSLLPYQHGVVHGRVRAWPATVFGIDLQEVLPDAVTTLAEVLAANGYETFGFATNPYLTASHGFAQGFGTYVLLEPAQPDATRGEPYADAIAVREAVRGARARIRAGSKVFVWLHFMDPHEPYHLRQPFFGSLEPDAHSGTLPTRVAGTKDFGARRISPAKRRELLEAYYDSEIAYAMHELGAIWDALDLGTNVLVVFTADHGEAFFEHGYRGHSGSLYGPEIRIPLAFRFPESAGIAARRVGDPVSIVDVVPTVLDFLGIDAPPDAAGRSLMGLARGAAPSGAVPLYGDLSLRDVFLSFVRLGGWKLIFSRANGREELYDLAADPGETRSRIDDAPQAHARLRALLDKNLEARRVSSARPDVRPVAPATADALEALGYGVPAR